MADPGFSLSRALGPRTAEIPLLASVDVLVVGGGSAGCAAAAAAARTGARVLLVERYGFLGGIGAGVLDTFYGFYTPGVNKKVVGGIGDEVVDALTKQDAAFIRANTYGAGGGVTYCPETLKMVWDDLCHLAGVNVLLHSYCTDVVISGDNRSVVGALLTGKAGLMRVDARQVVDATGDADVCARAGAAYDVAGENAPAQALTTTFRVAGVDTEQARSFPKEQLFRLMREAAASGDYNLPRLEGSIHRTPVEGMALANMTRLEGYDPLDPVSLTRAEVDGRSQVRAYVRFLRDRVPGYGDCRLAAMSTQVGVRESRRVHGDYQLTVDDVLSARKFPDVIAQCGAPVEDHTGGSDTTWAYIPDCGVYDVPFRCLSPRGLDNVLVAGRCLSATHEAHASCRSIAQCMAMGQAAGTAAAMAAGEDVAPRALKLSDLQDHLMRDGAILSDDQHGATASAAGHLGERSRS